ncbi:MAG TPA: DUF4112 domain-containing protein [Stellaceae bacterium]|nr:DUF4112 domain-containing protein [Stellaceae bacterium]
MSNVYVSMMDAVSLGATDARQVRRRLARIRRVAWLVDAAFRVPGLRFRFGLNSLLGLPPVAGDAALAVVSLYLIYEAARLGVPRAKLLRMLANVGVEVAVGSVPVLGDLLDMVWKANLRNLEIVERHLGVDA